MKKPWNLVGLFFSTLLVVVTVPYTVLEYLNKQIPFDWELAAFSGVAIFLFGLNLYYYKLRR